MKMRMDRFVAGILMVFLDPIVLIGRLVRFLAGYRKPIYKNTIEGDPLAYKGDHPLLIAVWADWASVWTAATADVVAQLQQEFAGRCEFAYVEASLKPVTDALEAKIVPVLILRHKGQEVGRFVNTMDVEEIRPAIASILN